MTLKNSVLVLEETQQARKSSGRSKISIKTSLHKEARDKGGIQGHYEKSSAKGNKNLAKMRNNIFFTCF